MNPLNPSNQEHIEAAQASADTTREKIKSALVEGDLAKHKAVEDAVKTLTDAGVNFYLFPELARDNGFKAVWQWNSLSCFAEFDDAGKPTEEYKRRNSEYHDSLLNVFFHFFKNLTKESEYAKQLNVLPALFRYCISKESERYERYERHERETGHKL